MTKADKPVTRQTYSRHRGREIVVTVCATWIEFRLKGKRARFTLDIQGALERAMYLAAEQARREKKAARMERRKDNRTR